MKISQTEIKLPKPLKLEWEQIRVVNICLKNIFQNSIQSENMFPLLLELNCYFDHNSPNSETDSRNQHFFVPKANFLEHIEDYQHNKFIDIGRKFLFNFCNLYYYRHTVTPHQGKYPGFLWLFKDIIEDLRDQLVFHDHLVAGVNEWTSRIREELKSDKDIIFIGVHNRY